MYRQMHTRHATSALNQLLRDAVERHPPPMHRGRRIKLYYTVQIATAPPTFAIFTNTPKGIHFSYQRYLANRFREGAGSGSRSCTADLP